MGRYRSNITDAERLEKQEIQRKKQKERTKQYYELHKAYRIEQAQKWRLEHPDKEKEYYQKNKQNRDIAGERRVRLFARIKRLISEDVLTKSDLERFVEEL